MNLDDADRARLAAAVAQVLAAWPDGVASSELRAYRRLLACFARETPPLRDDGPTGMVAVMDTTTAARLLGCTPQAVRARCRRGTLPAVRVGSSWAIDAAALEGRP